MSEVEVFDTLARNCEKLFPDSPSKDWDKIGDEEVYISGGILHLPTNQLAQFDETYFYSQSEKAPI